VIVAEADEFDRSFLTLYPEMAVLSSMDADHLDIYHSPENIRRGFEAFLAQIRDQGKLILKQGLEPEIPEHVRAFRYALDDNTADYFAIDLVHEGLASRFSVRTPDMIIPDLHLGLPGALNVENAVAAVAVAHQLGLTPEVIARNLGAYLGVERRFDVRLHKDTRIYIDDYAHHPTEIRAFLDSVRALFPDKRLTGVFQPHLYSRTRDFAEGFARSLEMLDELVLLDIYPAREEPIPGVSSSLIFDQVNLAEKVLIRREQLLKVIRERNPELLVTMGAGDINQFVEPLKDWMDRI
jgi:UDP-N-acetylmuramate--alanine ligase